jgi:serine/threonine protein kinase
MSHPLRPFTRDIVTLWYRAPEVLLGSEKYSTSVDIWSIGCIFAEMITKKPLFMGDSQVGQIFKIFEVLGTPTESNWPGIMNVPNYKISFPKFSPKKLSGLIPKLDSEGLDLLSKMLNMYPGNRISAKKALEHPYFDEIRILN